MIGAVLLALLALVQDKSANGEEWAEARIERPVPAEAKVLGHHGVVMLEANVSPEGRAIDLIVAQTSHSSLLDAEATAKLTNARIEPVLIASGQKRIRIAVDFNNYDLDNMGLGYLCGQAVLDADWYRSVSQAPSVERSAFSNYIRGTALVDDRMAFARDPKRFETAWQAALDFCRGHVETPFLGVVVLAGNHRLPKP